MLTTFNKLYDYITSVASQHLIEELRTNLPTNQHFLKEMRQVIDIYATFLKPFKTLTELCQSAELPTLPLIA